MKPRECGSCHHFTKNKADLSGKTGQCRRYPPNAMPVMTPQGPQILADFVPCNSDWNCGEWQVDIKVGLGMGSVKSLSDVSQVNGG